MELWLVLYYVPSEHLVGSKISVSAEFENRGNTSLIYNLKMERWMVLYYVPWEHLVGST